MRKEQIDLAIQILLSKNSAFEAGTGYGKTDIMVLLISEGAKQLYGEKYTKRISVFSDASKAKEAENLLKGDFNQVNNELLRISEKDLQDPTILQKIREADTIFIDPSVLCFAYNEKVMANSRNWISRQAYDLLTKRVYMVQDEFHVAAIDNTPHITGMGKEFISAQYIEYGRLIWSALGEEFGKDWVNGRDRNGATIFTYDLPGQRRLTAAAQERILNKILEKFVGVKGAQELDLKFVKNVISEEFIGPKEIKERLEKVKTDKKEEKLTFTQKDGEREARNGKKESALSGNEDWIGKANKFAEDWNYIVDAIHKSALITGWKEGSGNQYAFFEGKIVPVHNGDVAPNMHFSDAAIRVALELFYENQAKGSYRANFYNLEISPESIQSTWSRVLTEIKEQGGNVKGMTATLRGVAGVVNYGFDMAVSLGLDPRLKYDQNTGTNKVKGAYGILSFGEGVSVILARTPDGKDIVVVRGAEDINETREILSQFKSDKFQGRYRMLMEGDGVNFYSKDGEFIKKLSVDEAKWLLARGTEAFNNECPKEVKESLRNLVGDNDRIVAYINKPGSTGTDWKMSEKIKGHVFLGENTSDIAAYQAEGRFRETVGSSLYPEMEVFVIGKEMRGKIEAGDLDALLFANGIRERQKAQYEVALNGLTQAQTNTLETLLKNAKTGAEREAINNLNIKWQNQSHQDTYLGAYGIKPEEVLRSTYKKAQKFLEQETKDIKLCSENKAIVKQVLREIAQVEVELGKNELTGADEVLMQLKGGVFGAANVAEGMRFINARLSKADLPEFVSKGNNQNVSAGLSKIANDLESTLRRPISAEETEGLKTLLEKGSSSSLEGSPEVIRAIISYASPLQNGSGSQANVDQGERLLKAIKAIGALDENQPSNSAADLLKNIVPESEQLNSQALFNELLGFVSDPQPVFQGLAVLHDVMTASPEEYKQIIEENQLINTPENPNNPNALLINQNPGSWKGLTDAERATLADALLNMKGLKNPKVMDSAGRNLIASVLNPLYRFDDLRGLAWVYNLFVKADYDMAKKIPFSFNTASRQEAEEYFRNHDMTLRRLLTEKIFGRMKPEAIYSYDRKGRQEVMKVFRSLKYPTVKIDKDRNMQNFMKKIPLVSQDAAISGLASWAAGRKLRSRALPWRDRKDDELEIASQFGWNELTQINQVLVGLKDIGAYRPGMRRSKILKFFQENDMRGFLKYVNGGMFSKIGDEKAKKLAKFVLDATASYYGEYGPDEGYVFTGDMLEGILEKELGIKNDDAKLKYLPLFGIVAPDSWKEFMNEVAPRVALTSWVHPNMAKKEELDMLIPDEQKLAKRVIKGDAEAAAEFGKLNGKFTSKGIYVDPDRLHGITWKELQEVAWQKMELNNRFSLGFGEDLLNVEFFAVPWLEVQKEKYLKKGDSEKVWEIENLLAKLGVDDSKVKIAQKNIAENMKMIKEAAIKNISVTAKKLGLTEKRLQDVLLLPDGEFYLIAFAAGREMVRKGNSYSESVNIGDGTFGLKFNFSRMVRDPYTLNEVVHYFDIPHEFMHIGLDLFNKEHKDGKEISAETGSALEKTFGKGVLKKILDKDGRLKVDLKFGGNTTYNELFATIGGLRSIMGNSALIKVKKYAIENLTKKKDARIDKIHKKDFQEIRKMIESARPDLRVNDKKENIKKTENDKTEAGGKNLSILRATLAAMIALEAGNVKIEELGDEEFDKAVSAEGGFGVGIKAYGSEKKGNNEFYLRKIVSAVTRLVAILHDGSHKLGDLKEEKEEGFMVGELAALKDLINKQGNRALKKAFAAFVNKLENDYDNPISGLLKSIGAGTVTTSSDDLKAHLTAIKDRVNTSRHFNELLPETLNFLVELEAVLNQEQVTPEDVVKLSQIEIKKSDYGVALELFGHVFPFMIVPEEAREFHKGDKKLLKFVYELKKNKDVIGLFDDHFTKIGWKTEILRSALTGFTGESQELGDLSKQAQNELARKNYSGAVDLYKEILTQDIGNYVAWYQIGYIYALEGFTEEAIAAYKKAVFVGKDRDTAIHLSYIKLGKLYYDRQEYAFALEVLQEASKAALKYGINASERVEIERNIGDTYNQMQDYVSAVKAFEKALWYAHQGSMDKDYIEVLAQRIEDVEIFKERQRAEFISKAEDIFNRSQQNPITEEELNNLGNELNNLTEEANKLNVVFDSEWYDAAIRTKQNIAEQTIDLHRSGITGELIKILGELGNGWLEPEKWQELNQELQVLHFRSIIFGLFSEDTLRDTFDEVRQALQDKQQEIILKITEGIKSKVDFKALSDIAKIKELQEGLQQEITSARLPDTQKQSLIIEVNSLANNRLEEIKGSSSILAQKQSLLAQTLQVVTGSGMGIINKGIPTGNGPGADSQEVPLSERKQPAIPVSTPINLPVINQINIIPGINTLGALVKVSSFATNLQYAIDMVPSTRNIVASAISGTATGLAPPIAYTSSSLSEFDCVLNTRGKNLGSLVVMVGSSVVSAVRSAVSLIERLVGARSANSEGQGAEGAFRNIVNVIIWLRKVELQ
ncbi:MAG: tetratricopeptide repeat protein [Candidatus Omnitrophota bacterium]